MLGSLIVLWLLVLWLIVPGGLVALPETIFHILGVAILLVLGRQLPAMIGEMRDTKVTYIGWGLTAYCADVTRHMFGDLLFVAFLAFPPASFLPILPLTAIEQAMYAVSSALIGASALLAVKKAKLDVPIMRLKKQRKLAQANKFK